MNKKPIAVVLGGSFNPPTKAHRILMGEAMKCLGADKGIYVPSSDTYVSRKVSRQTDSRVLSEETRLAMLQEMCDKQTQVSTCEYGDTSKGRTLKTLEEIQASLPDYDIWFIIGCDKIEVFHKWGTCKTILEKFHLLWVGRDNIDARQKIASSDLLSQYPDRQKFLEEPDSADGISSSEFWRRYTRNDPTAYELLDSRIQNPERYFSK